MRKLLFVMFLEFVGFFAWWWDWGPKSTALWIPT